VSWVVVTQVDKLLDERVTNKINELARKKFNFDAPDAVNKLRVEEKEVMENIKAEVKLALEEAKNPELPLPPLLWTVLAPDSWLYKGPREPHFRRRRKPEDIVSSVKEIQEIFDIKDTAEIRSILDYQSGITDSQEDRECFEAELRKAAEAAGVSMTSGGYRGE